MENNAGTMFSARIVPKELWFFWLIFGFFFVLGIFFLLRGPETAMIGRWFAGGAAFCLAMMLWSAFGIKVRYGISPSGIFVSRFVFGKRFPFSELREIRKVSQKEVEEMFWSLRGQRFMPVSPLFGIKALKRGAPKFTKGAFLTVPQEWRLARYATVPVLRWNEDLSAITDIKLEQTWGDFVLITTTGDKRYLLSPQDTDGFVEAAKWALEKYSK